MKHVTKKPKPRARAAQKPRTARATTKPTKRTGKATRRAVLAILADTPKQKHRAIKRAVNKPAPPPCGHERTRVLETRRVPYTREGQRNQVRRRLKCVSCGHRFSEYQPQAEDRRRPKYGKLALESRLRCF